MTVDRWQWTDDSLKNDVLIKWRFDQVTNERWRFDQVKDDLLIDRWRFDQVTF